MSKLSIFERKKGGPKLKGRAAQVASLAVPMFHLWVENMDAANPVHKKIKTWLKMNMLTEKILKKMQKLWLWDLKLPPNLRQ